MEKRCQLTRDEMLSILRRSSVSCTIEQRLYPDEFDKILNFMKSLSYGEVHGSQTIGEKQEEPPQKRRRSNPQADDLEEGEEFDSNEPMASSAQGNVRSNMNVVYSNEMNNDEKDCHIQDTHQSSNVPPAKLRYRKITVEEHLAAGGDPSVLEEVFSAYLDESLDEMDEDVLEHLYDSGLLVAVSDE